MQRWNPYSDFGAIVTGPRFLGRKAEVRTVETRLLGGVGFGSVAVVGLPRVGKTSLIREVLRRAESRMRELRAIVLWTNVGEFESISDLFRRLLLNMDEVLREQQLHNPEIEHRISSALAESVLDFGSVRGVFRSLRRANIRPIYVLDEFDAGRRLFEHTPQYFHWIRELSSNPEFKAAVVIVAKRRLQDVSRLAGFESDYWANVLMTLHLGSFSDEDVREFFSTFEAEGGVVDSVWREDVLELCGRNPYLLDCFAYHAWERLASGEGIQLDWLREVCSGLFSQYVKQVVTVLDDGYMLSKAIQVLVGPQWNVTSDDVLALRDLGVVQGDRSVLPKVFEQQLSRVARTTDVWPLWSQTERAIRSVLESELKLAYGTRWPDELGKARPHLKAVIDRCREMRNRDRRHLVSSESLPCLLAYTYPAELFDVMCVDWQRFGKPFLGGDKRGWAVKFDILAKMRTPFAHNREEAVSKGMRLQAEGICYEIIARFESWLGASSGTGAK